MADVDDAQLRSAAMQWLERRTHGGLLPMSTADLAEFEFSGQRIPLVDKQRGIRKPAVLDAALSIRTVYRADGQLRPYEDGKGPDDLYRYKWRGDDALHAENRALRSAMERNLPLIWFLGIGGGLYQATFPVFLIREEPEQQQFVLDVIGVTDGLVTVGSRAEDAVRRYIMSETRRRLHQPVFRATVIRAYEQRCAVCALHHPQLLDAAHIVPDRDEAGVAAVGNGMALCIIHHAAFDTYILGVRPDLVVEIRADLLHEKDGPMLQHGLQGRHGQPLMWKPRAAAERPDRDLLEQSYERFRAAG